MRVAHAFRARCAVRASFVHMELFRASSLRPLGVSALASMARRSRLFVNGARV
jgi:hypothetical protein